VKYLLVAVTLLAACAPAYHTHVQIQGEPTHVDVRPTSQVREQDTAPPHAVIDRTIYYIDAETPADVLSGWVVVFCGGGAACTPLSAQVGDEVRTWEPGEPATFCASRTIYVDATAHDWRDQLAHEVGEAWLCETTDPHLLLRALGACYGGCQDLEKP
jgi:hypothetical protein